MPERGSVRIMRYLGKGGGALEGSQAAGKEVEEKVRCFLRERGRGYIDRAAGIRRQAMSAKAARDGYDA